jgi:hypothetical protein
MHWQLGLLTLQTIGLSNITLILNNGLHYKDGVCCYLIMAVVFVRIVMMVVFKIFMMMVVAPSIFNGEGGDGGGVSYNGGGCG